MNTRKYIRKKEDGYEPYGHIAGVIKTEWGYLFNTKQYLS